MINILYICTPNSIHDIKWMSFFAVQKDKYKVYAVGEKNIILNLKEVESLELMGINVLPPIGGFSILNIFSTIYTVILLRKYISEFKIDIVHAFVATPFALWLNFLNTKCVLTTRGTDVLITIPELKNKCAFNFKKKILIYLFQRSFKKASLVTCTSMSQIEFVSKMFIVKRLELVRTGVNVSEIDELKCVSSELPNQKYILFPRYLNNPLYNVELQIKSIQYLSKEIIDKYTFVFIKKDGYMDDFSVKIKNELESISMKIGLKFVIFDYLDQFKLWSLYKKASLVVMTPFSDGTPNTALEAMSAKCPLILPNLNYDEILFKDACLRLEKYDPIELARKIESALYDYPKEYISNAFNNVERYGNRMVEMKRLSEYYNEVLNL